MLQQRVPSATAPLGAQGQDSTVSLPMDTGHMQSRNEINHSHTLQTSDTVLPPRQTRRPPSHSIGTHGDTPGWQHQSRAVVRLWWPRWVPSGNISATSHRAVPCVPVSCEPREGTETSVNAETLSRLQKAGSG